LQSYFLLLPRLSRKSHQDTSFQGVERRIFAAYPRWVGPHYLPKRTIPGATDTEIKIGNIPPYSGHLSAYGVIGMTEAAYFREINGEGGIKGRKINFISYYDSYRPPKFGTLCLDQRGRWRCARRPNSTSAHAPWRNDAMTVEILEDRQRLK